VKAKPTVGEALRGFLPAFLARDPPLFPPQRRAIWAITHCRTPALGGRAFPCPRCQRVHLAFHSCNHKACPICGRAATARWIRREVARRINAPYFMVTFTLPAELRGEFFGPMARQAYDLFFAAVSAALSEKLAADKSLRAQVNGFTAVLHTWNQQLLFHPHIHCLVPGAGLDAKGRPVRVKKADFLVYVPHLQEAFRQHMRRLLEHNHWSVDPVVWTKDWGVHILPAGSGAQAIKYLGNYVARTAISDRRILALDDSSLTFTWKDRAYGNRVRVSTLSGTEFVQRYLRHVLPQRLRSVRYYGFCHPTAKANRLRIQFPGPVPAPLTDTLISPVPDTQGFCCPNCGTPLRWATPIPPATRQRGPPAFAPSQLTSLTAA